jgi:hypothetical protein
MADAAVSDEAMVAAGDAADVNSPSPQPAHIGMSPSSGHSPETVDVMESERPNVSPGSGEGAGSGSETESDTNDGLDADSSMDGGMKRTDNTVVKAEGVTPNESKPFACPLCPFRTRTRALLKSHSYRHEGMPHQCDQCPRGFAGVKDLARHKFRKHGGPPLVRCSDCGLEYVLNSELERHRFKKHGGPRPEDLPPPRKRGRPVPKKLPAPSPDQPQNSVAPPPIPLPVSGPSSTPTGAQARVVGVSQNLTSC